MNTATRPLLPFRFPELLSGWWPVILGLAALYIPTYWTMANGIWNTEEQAHGPIVLAVVLFLVWQKRDVLLSTAVNGQSVGRLQAAVGWILLVLGLISYVLGRTQSLLIFEIGSHIPVVLGAMLITLGVRQIKALWFPLFFILFMIPLPGFIVDSATGSLKQYVSVLAENIIYFLDYPIARSGVVLTIGQYQLLVADACSGLHSMFSLSAMGLLYLYLMAHTNWARNAILISAILPIAFAANVVRVIVLVLVTYHFGDEAGQGFVHDFAGLLLFVVGLLFLFVLDALLGFFLPDRGPAGKAK
jgi:exosortase B